MCVRGESSVPAGFVWEYMTLHSWPNRLCISDYKTLPSVTRASCLYQWKWSNSHSGLNPRSACGFPGGPRRGLTCSLRGAFRRRFVQTCVQMQKESLPFNGARSSQEDTFNVSERLVLLQCIIMYHVYDICCIT